MNSNSNLDELLKRTCFSSFIPEYTVFDGTVLSSNYNKIANDIENFEVKDSDIWIASYPKTGTTWTQEMIWLIANDLDFEGAKESLSKRYPFLEIEMIYNFDEIEKVTEQKWLPHVKNSVQYVNSLTENPRFIKTHLPWNFLPKQIRNNEKKPKIIYVTRNPKDTCVSWYHHYKLLQYYTGTFEEFCTLFLNDKVLYSSYWDNIEGFWERRNDPNVLFLKYEDSKADLKATIAKIAKFLGKTVPVDKMDQLLNHLSFDAMQKNTAINFNKKIDNEERHFIRKGIVGDHKNQMSPEMIKTFDDWIKERNTFGITF